MKNIVGYLMMGLLMINLSCSSSDDGLDAVIEEVVAETPIEEVIVEQPVEVEVVEEVVIEEVNENSRETVVINELNYAGSGDWIEIYNPTSEVVNIADYWLCLGPQTYQQILNLTVQGNTMLGSGEYAVITGYILPDSSAGLGLYDSNGNFTSTESIIDYVQYGEGTSPRINVAEEALLWYEGQFLPTVASVNNSIVYSGEGFGIESWTETTLATPGADNVFNAPN